MITVHKKILTFSKLKIVLKELVYFNQIKKIRLDFLKINFNNSFKSNKENPRISQL